MLDDDKWIYFWVPRGLMLNDSEGCWISWMVLKKDWFAIRQTSVQQCCIERCWMIKILSNRGLHFRFLVVHLIPETRESCYLHIIRKKFGESELGDKSMTNKSLLDSSKKQVTKVVEKRDLWRKNWKTETSKKKKPQSSSSLFHNLKTTCYSRKYKTFWVTKRRFS